MQQHRPSSPRSTFGSGVGVRVLAAFLAGAVIGALSMVQVVPEDEGGRSRVVAVDPGATPGAGGEVGTVEELPEGTALDPGDGSGGGGVEEVVDEEGRVRRVRRSTGSGGSGSGGSGSGGGGSSGGPDGGSTGSTGTQAAPEGVECAPGRNGGETDTGVTGDKIRLASTVVTSGDGSSFLGEAPLAMQAVVNRVNSQGGICGRTIELRTQNDEWDARRGAQFIRDFIAQGYFALPVVPSSEGLTQAIKAGDIQRAGIPVAGTDGMLKEQYDADGQAGMVWPVATATVSQVRIMAKYAYDQGARRFGIVYDQRYRFGVEGAQAYEQYVKSLSGASLDASMGIQPRQSSYTSQANQFTGDCDPCDLVVLLLEPETAVTWMGSAGESGKGKIMTAGAQPLFNRNFSRGCGEVCDGVWVWSGYNPAIGENQNRPDIARYMDEVRSVNPSADTDNQFTQGAWLGMNIFVKALETCSPVLTRDCIRQHMDSLDYESDHTSRLSWRPGDHFANLGARGYSIAYSGGSFTGFRDEQTGFVQDPTPGVVPGG